MFQSTKPVPGTVYYARPTGGGSAPALYTAPQYSSAPVSAPATSQQLAPTAQPARSWLPWLIGGGIAAGALWLVLRD